MSLCDMLESQLQATESAIAEILSAAVSHLLAADVRIGLHKRGVDNPIAIATCLTRAAAGGPAPRPVQ